MIASTSREFNRCVHQSQMQSTCDMRVSATAKRSTAKRSTGPHRHRLHFDTAKTLHRFRVHGGSHARRRRHVATDDTVHPHYVHHIHPVVVREHHQPRTVTPFSPSTWTGINGRMALWTRSSGHPYIARCITT